MAVIKINNFGGEVPSVLPRNLSPDAAQVAQNIQAQTAEFRPVAASDFVVTAPVTGTLPAGTSPKTIYRAVRNADKSLNLTRNAGWRATAKHVRIAKSPLDDNLTDRNYATTEDGSEPPVAFDAQGALRQLGVPAPDTAPTCVLKESYTFTPEVRVTETNAAMATLLKNLEAAVVGSVGGYSPKTTDAGWIRASALQAPDEKVDDLHVWRLFAVDPATDKLLNTHSLTLPVAEAGWVFDPSLGGQYVTNQSGQPMPSWANGFSKWWGIKFRASYGLYDINPTISTSVLSAIDMPGTQGTQKWITPAEAAALTTRLQTEFDKDDAKVTALVQQLTDAQAALGATFDKGAATTLTLSVADFYQRPEVASVINAAKDVWVNFVWGLAVRVGTAKAPDTGVSTDTGSAGGD